MTHPHDQAPAPLAAEVVSMVAQLRQRAIFAKAENTGTAQGDAWHFDGAADMLTALAAENATLRASEVAALERVKVLEAELAAAEANINIKADWIDATINDMAQGEQDAADLVTVKPLEWHEISRSPARWMGHQAVVTNRDYIIHLTSDSPDVYVWGLDCEVWSGFCDTLQEAKDAAQLDYVRGVLSSLTPTADKEPKT